MTEKINMETVGAFIRQERKTKPYTKDLGEAVGVSDKAVSKWERDFHFQILLYYPLWQMF